MVKNYMNVQKMNPYYPEEYVIDENHFQEN